jgi:urease accessory protein
LFIEKLVIEPQRYPMRQTGVMDSFDVLGNVIVCTPKDKTDRIFERAGANVDSAGGLAFGACRLPNDAGLIYEVGPRNHAGKSQSTRVLGSGARGGHRRRPPSPVSLALAGQRRSQSF